MATIMLLGVENDLATQLSRVLRSHEHNVKITDSIETVILQRNLILSSQAATGRIIARSCGS